jgi:hypothetical protein
MQRCRGIEGTKMSTVLGMMVMMPVVFGVGGYALVSRRPEINANMMTGGPSVRPQVSHHETFVHIMLRRTSSALGGVTSQRSQYIDRSRGEIR